ncbi:unnamed protein product [Urochloa humidicola]
MWLEGRQVNSWLRECRGSPGERSSKHERRHALDLTSCVAVLRRLGLKCSWTFIGFFCENPQLETIFVLKSKIRAR